MDAIAYWVPWAGLLVVIAVPWAIQVLQMERMRALIAEEKEMLAAADTSIMVLAQRNRNFAEALELMNYGARDEAIELLRNWGEVRIVSS